MNIGSKYWLLDEAPPLLNKLMLFKHLRVRQKKIVNKTSKSPGCFFHKEIKKDICELPFALYSDILYRTNIEFCNNNDAIIVHICVTKKHIAQPLKLSYNWASQWY